MEADKVKIPELIQDNLGEDCLHIFFIQNPVAVIMSLMIADAYKIPQKQAYAVSIRHTTTGNTGFASLPLNSRSFDRYLNRLSGRNFPGIRLRQELNRTGLRYLVYASWVYPEIEEVISSPQCMGHIVFEEGQQSYYDSTPYQKNFFNSWFFRRKKILYEGSINHYYRNDTSAFVGMSPATFPKVPEDKRYVLRNMSTAAQKYAPRLKGVRSIGLMPAPRRLARPDVFPAIERLICTIDGPGVIKMHPGFRCEAYYSQDVFSNFIEDTSNGWVKLCPDDILIEFEMLVEKKELYGARSSLSRYAQEFGSTFHEISFNNYIKPII